MNNSVEDTPTVQASIFRKQRTTVQSFHWSTARLAALCCYYGRLFSVRFVLIVQVN